MTDLLDRFRNLNVWQRGGERAPHKPLLLLLALGRLSRGEPTVPFEQCESALVALLREFGPSRKSYHAEYPFWRLQNDDGLWVVSAQSELPARQSNTDPPRTALRSAHAVGALAPDLVAQLRKKPFLIAEAAQQLLDDNFPGTLHQDILDAVGLDLEVEARTQRRRDPNFRGAVLLAYQYRCALCELDIRMGTVSMGLEAAHVKWHQARGPGTVNNGVAFCALHHKFFDFGAFTVDEGHRVLVSEQVNGSRMVEDVLLRFHGKQLVVPRRTDEHPRPDYLQWHLKEVFKQRALP